MVNDEASMTGQWSTDADPPPTGERSTDADPPPTGERSTDADPPSTGERSTDADPPSTGERSTDADPSSTGEAIVLNETIHQTTRLRIMTLLVSMPEADRLAYGFIQKTLGLTGGNLTIHLRKLQDAGYLVITKEFQGSKPRTWVQATTTGRQAFAKYLSNLEKALGLRVNTAAADDGRAGGL